MPNLRTGIRAHPILWLLVGLKGRISRQAYWLGCVFLFSVNGILLSQAVGGPESSFLFGGVEATFFREAQLVAPFVLLATIYSNIAVTIKRLHDVGYSGFLAVALFVPLVNLFFTIWVGILPGMPGPNAYGDVTDSPPA